MYLPLATLNADGSPPASRLNDAAAVRTIIERLLTANGPRAKVDATVFGLVTGNLPYKWGSLSKRGELWRTNTNWRIAEAFLDNKRSVPWDVVTEAPVYCNIQLSRAATKDDDKLNDWSQAYTELFDKLNRADADLNYMFLRSQYEMILYRCGPCVWENEWDYRACSLSQGDLLLPNRAPSCVNKWKQMGAITAFTADELYACIRDPATATHWNVPEARRALMNVFPAEGWPANRRNDWAWYEQGMNNNDLYIGDISESIQVGNFYYREFPKEGEMEGRITHCMVLMDGQADKFLYRQVGRYAKWQQFINPFYYDSGDGTHHSVKGDGIKFYGALETYNRLMCHLVDLSFINSSNHWQAATANDLQNLSIEVNGPNIIHPPGITHLPMQMHQSMDGPLAVKQDLLSTVTNNLSQYRQEVNQKSGNPVTKREIDMQSTERSTLPRSQISRYFEQLDDFWAERLRRATNPDLLEINPGGKEALAFQRECVEAGIPRSALRQVESVRAYRTAGFGSRDERMQAMQRMLARLATYDERGRDRVLQDLDALDVGYANARRYRPTKKTLSANQAEQIADATDKVAGMKVGVQPGVAPSQNPVIYASVYLKAADAAAGTIAQSQGATTREVFSFLEACCPAIRAQLDRFAQDPTRKALFENMDKHYEKLAGLQDQLGKQLQQQAQQKAQQQKQLQEKSSQLNGELALKAQSDQMKAQLKDREVQHRMRLRQQQAAQKQQLTDTSTRQQLAIADATTAADVSRKNVQASADVRRKNAVAASTQAIKAKAAASKPAAATKK